MSHEAIRRRHANIHAGLARLAKTTQSLMGGLVALSTDESAVVGRVTRIGLIDHRAVPNTGADGKQCGWMAWKYIVYPDGAEKPLQCEAVKTEDEAWTLCEKWEREERRKDNASPKPEVPKEGLQHPETCDPLSQQELNDAWEAKLKVLIRMYPQVFAVFARMSAPSLTREEYDKLKQEAEEAFLLDAAVISGAVATPFPLKAAQFILKLAAALTQSKRRKRKSKLLDLDFELAWGYVRLGYCYMSGEELASAINAKLGTNYTSKLIAKRRNRGLGLISKQHDGRKVRKKRL